MSKYTTQVRFICETASGLKESEGQVSVKQVIAGALPSVFDFDFPIFDEAYRSVLETKILKHYYTREIGMETVGLWKLKLDTKLNEIMPYYNMMYKSELLDFNPFYDTDLTRDHVLSRDESENRDGTSNSTEDRRTDETNFQENISDTTINNESTSNSDSNNQVSSSKYDKYSDTPQGSLQNVQDGTYLTNARMLSDTSTNLGDANVHGTDESYGSTVSETTGDTASDMKRDLETITSNDRVASTLDDYLEHVKGKSGSSSYSNLLMEFRKTFLNIDMMIIDELADLFFNLW